MATHKFSKKDLKQDSFITSTERALEFLQRNATAVGAGLLVLVVLLIGGTYWKQSRAAAQAEASDQFYQGQLAAEQGDYQTAAILLRDCVEQHGGTEYGRHARPALVNAILGTGDVELALAEAERFGGDLPPDHAAADQLALAHATALADAGRYGDAAAMLEARLTPDLDDALYVGRTMRCVQWRREAGDHAGALALLEQLDARIAAGEIDAAGLGLSLEREIEAARVLAR